MTGDKLSSWSGAPLSATLGHAPVASPKTIVAVALEDCGGFRIC
jgi:hypothetical protein